MTRFGAYELHERLGQGGIGEVYRASISGPENFRRTLALKRLRPDLTESPEFVELFLREARLSALLHHPNLVQVFELGEIDGSYFLALELVEGVTVAQIIKQQRAIKRPCPPKIGALILAECLSGLEHAHDLRAEDGSPLELIHRDISPQNVIASYSGTVKLLDFGLAKALALAGENKTATGVLRGKANYMAPELLLGEAADRRSDLFACGVVLWELLTSHHLFRGQTAAQTYDKVLRDPIPPPSEHNPEVPAELDEICLRALARDPKDRYQTAAQMAKPLRDLCHASRWAPAALASELRFLADESGPRPPTLLASPHALFAEPLRHRLRARWVAVALPVLGIAAAAAVWPLQRRSATAQPESIVAPPQPVASTSPAPAPPEPPTVAPLPSEPVPAVKREKTIVRRRNRSSPDRRGVTKEKHDLKNGDPLKGRNLADPFER